MVTQQSLQEDIQGQLPVIPNNGNPGGAYNMGRQVASAEPAPQQAPPDPYAWLQPTEFMNTAKQLLEKQMVEMAAETTLNPSGKPLSFAPGVFQGQPGYQVRDNTGIPISSDVPFVTENPYGVVLPQMTQHNFLPTGTILPMRRVP